MPTIAREIDALGGAHEDSDWGQGFNAALEAAEPIAENADALVEELLECIGDILVGNTTLANWVAQATLLVTRARHQRNR